MILAPLLLASALAAPTAAPTRVCSRDAAAKHAAQPDFPDAARNATTGPVYVEVAVHLDAKGDLTDANVTHSSGNAAIDAATLRAVRESTYLPKIKGCKAVPGVFVFRADFNP